jgi:hypothetical protein
VRMQRRGRPNYVLTVARPGRFRGVAASEDVPPRFETLLHELAAADPDLALDLLTAVRSYTGAETHLIAIDKRVGRNVGNRVARLVRLELVSEILERDLSSP